MSVIRALLLPRMYVAWFRGEEGENRKKRSRTFLRFSSCFVRDFDVCVFTLRRPHAMMIIVSVEWARASLGLVIHYLTFDPRFTKTISLPSMISVSQRPNDP